MRVVCYPQNKSLMAVQVQVQVLQQLRSPLTMTSEWQQCPSSLSTCGLFNLPRPLTLTSIRISQRRRMPVAGVVEESQESSEPEADLASELKKAMAERKEKEEDNLFSGVAREIDEIEWPAFGKVLGTTGVVLSVILGSSVVLLTLNAVLAELSDRIFAAKGIQDFFT